MRLVKTVLAGALVITSLPLTATTAAPPVPSFAEHRARRAALLDGLPVADQLADVGSRAGAATVWDEAYLMPAGDLDGTKGEDFVDVRYHIDSANGGSETVTFDARRGHDGKQLWTLALPPATFVLPFFTRVGTDGKRGLLVFTYTRPGTGSAAAVEATGLNLTVAAFAGATGTPLWAVAPAGAYARTPAVEGVAGDPWAAGILNAAPGAADDVLVMQENDAVLLPDGTAAGVAEASVVDGATGAVRPLGAPRVFEDMYRHQPGADFDKDGFDDVVAFARTAGGKMSFTATSSITGASLWSNVTLPPGHGRWTLGKPGDVTGDGVPDMTVTVPGPGSGAPQFGGGKTAVKKGGPLVALVNGATGKTVWSKRGTTAGVLGDVDKKKGAEVLVVEAVYGGGRYGFVAGAYTGTGRRVWSVSRLLRTASSPYLQGRKPVLVVPDVHGDGVPDLSFSVYSLNARGWVTAHDAGVVNGRTGKVTKDGPRDYLNPSVAAVDGKGADAYSVLPVSGATYVMTYTGDTRQPIWVVGVEAHGALFRSTGALADGDTCAELVIGLVSGSSTFIDVVLRGSSGQPAWVLTRTSTQAATVSKPAAAAYQFRKTC